jgi:hypothetical protein
MRAFLLSALLALPLPAAAGDAPWIEVTGHAFLTGREDADSARRRAVADALLQAALAGGAVVNGHTAIDKSVVTADLLIVRPVGRVLSHKVTGIRQTGDEVQVTIRARVGASAGGDCDTRRRLVLTAYGAEIRVSPEAPAWAEPLAAGVIRTLLDELARHPSVELVRTTRRALPQGDAARDGFDYETLTRGSVRLPAGQHALVPSLRLSVQGGGARDVLVMELDLSLVGGSGETGRQTLVREVALPAVSPFGRAAALTEPRRRTMEAKLTKGLDRAFAALLDVETCKPVVTRLAVAGGQISAPVGRRMGLTRGSIAFTADADHTTEMLEVVGLSAESVSLRPLDPNRPAAAFANRPVRFLEAGL